MKNKKIISLLLTLSLTTSILVTQYNPVSAEVNDSNITISRNNELSLLSKEDETTLRNELTRDGISIDVQNKLIEKKKKGESWDCEIPEKFNSIPDDFFKSLAFKNEIKYIFDDESYLILKKNDTNLNNINSYSLRSHYERNIPRATVEASYGGTRASIFANVSMFYGVQSKINSVEPDAYIHVSNGSLLIDPAPKITKKDGNNNSPATATYSPKISRDAPIGSGKTITLIYTMYVNGSTYWADLRQY